MVYELQKFQPASMDDIASVHARAYVAGLEKVIYMFFCVVFSSLKQHGDS